MSGNQSMRQSVGKVAKNIGKQIVNDLDPYFDNGLTDLQQAFGTAQGTFTPTSDATGMLGQPTQQQITESLTGRNVEKVTDQLETVHTSMIEPVPEPEPEPTPEPEPEPELE